MNVNATSVLHEEILHARIICKTAPEYITKIFFHFIIHSSNCKCSFNFRNLKVAKKGYFGVSLKTLHLTTDTDIKDASCLRGCEKNELKKFIVPLARMDRGPGDIREIG